MIIVHLIGGLGNQMFQYAAGKFLAFRNSSELKLDTSGFQHDPLHRTFKLNQFKINIGEADTRDLVRFKYSGLRRKLFDWKHGKHIIFEDMNSPLFRLDFFNLEGNILLRGYFQSEKYFKPIKNELLADFEIKRQPDVRNDAIIREIMRSNSVSIHIRRGDYIHNDITNEFHGICTMEYYQQAANYIHERIDDPQFYIFSDDIPWLEKNFKLNYAYKIISINNGKEIEDLRLMSYCQHQIIANSSFSWWGAWLNKNPDKIVIGPSNWVNKNSKWYKDWGLDDSHVLPESWIRI